MVALTALTGAPTPQNLELLAQDKKNKALVDNFKADKYNPEGYTLFSYAAVKVWAAAANGAKTTDATKVAAAMRAGSALSSTAFFSRFSAGGSHQGYLSAAELKLLADWLDIGAQYYNSPFVIPEQ